MIELGLVRQMLLGGLGGHELVLIAVIVLLMVGVGRLMELERAPSAVEAGRQPPLLNDPTAK